MRLFWIVLSTLFACDVSGNDTETEIEQAVLAECGAPKLAELTANTSTNETVVLNCSVSTLDSSVTIKKKILIQTSGVHLNCNGATIDNRSVSGYSPSEDIIQIASIETPDDGDPDLLPVWTRPSDVHVIGCNIKGSVRVFGMCPNGQDCPAQLESSKTSGHTQRSRNAAPTNILFDDVVITGVSRIPLYIGPGVTYFTMSNSLMDGTSVRSAVYLDAESGYNTFRGNQFLVDTDTDGGADSDDISPVISVDGSSNNLIVNNYFSGLDEGGIFLYRNCGEGGTVRWNTPSNNTIMNNVFYYSNYSGPLPAVWLGSRDDPDPTDPNNDGSCDYDVPFASGNNSGATNNDFATHNVVAQSQFYVRSIGASITLDSSGPNTPNYLASNTTVTTSHISRAAGCYYVNGFPNPLVLDGASLDMQESNGRPSCTSLRHNCNDGIFSTSSSSCSITTHSFGCTAINNNNGCSGTKSCSTIKFGGPQVIAKVAACNLESGNVTTAQLNAVPGGKVRVVQESTIPTHGICIVDSTSIFTGTSTIVGGSSWSTSFECDEYDPDGSGGDCHLLGTLYCR